MRHEDQKPFAGADEVERLAQDAEVGERFVQILRILTIVLAGGQILFACLAVWSGISGGPDHAGNAYMAAFAIIAVILVLLTSVPALIMSLTRNAPKTAFILVLIIPVLWIVQTRF